MSTQQAPHHTAPPPPPPSGPQQPSSGASLAPRIVLIGLPILVGIVVGITRPEVYTALFNSPQAIAIVAGIIAAILGLSALLRRYLSNQWLITGLLLVPLAVVGYLFIAPYYAEDVVVDEALPGLETAAVSADQAEEPAGAADAEAGSAEAEAPADDTAEAPTDAEGSAADPSVENEEAVGDSPAQDGAAQDGAAQDGAADSAAEPAGEPDVAQPEDVEPEPAPEEPAAPAGPVQLSNGTFVGLDNHFAEGEAAIYTLEDGSSIVRLEDVNLQQVPEAVVYLVPGTNQEGLAEGNINLGPLTGNVGSSNYAIPPEVDLPAGEWTVLVWCEVFASPVGGATQVAIG
ncbi:DM13 domain-containing protein [Euzebya tangerina]|uniref:DM13 domain-containing protein n=1 Tax=Euzebya tangerina TaxID=591198 RepID=UPI000E3215A0|nr:DM13 domain-containing protein [Euzebya tangerina]